MPFKETEIAIVGINSITAQSNLEYQNDCSEDYSDQYACTETGNFATYGSITIYQPLAHY